MRNRKLWWLGGAAILSALAAVSALVVTIKHEPSFYRHNQLPPGETRKELARNFLRNFAQMFAYIKGRQAEWGCDARETEINSFFQEAFVEFGEAEGLRSLGISSPSVSLQDKQFRMAFRYGKGWFSTVISYDLKIWLVQKEPNVIAVQVLSARAGAMPIPCSSILQQLSDFASKQNYKVTLYRHEGTPVAIIRLQENQASTSTLTMLTTDGNMLSIRGKTLEHALAPIVLTMPLPKVSAP